MAIKRKPEFWESDDFQDYFAGQGTPQLTGKIPSPYETPGLDIGALQERAIAPVERAYKRGVAGMETRLSRRKMGRSGAYMQEELDKFYDFITGIGGPSADIAFRGEELALKERLGMAELEQRERELALRERMGVSELGLEERRIDVQDRQFAEQLELQWADQGLNEQEIADKKEMFYAEQERLSEQFGRQYSLAETEAAWRHEEELGRQGLTQQEIDNEMKRFDRQLSWEKEHYGMVLKEEQRQFNEEMADAIRQTDLDFDKLTETIRQFDDTMKRLKDLDAFEMEMRERGMDLEEWKARKDVELREIELEMYSNKIFGYWDDGYAPGDENWFDGEKYEWDEKEGVWVETREWSKYQLEHYHMGDLDLGEWGLKIQAALGMVGVISGEEGEETELTTEVETYKRIEEINKRITNIQETLNMSPFLTDDQRNILEAEKKELYAELAELQESLGGGA